MKKFFRSLMVVAVAAMGITACHSEFDEPAGGSVNDSRIYVSFVAEAPATRTTVDTSSDEAPVFSWDESESFVVLEQTDALAVASDVAYERIDGKANITAAFATNVGKDAYNYVTVYPAGAYVAAESINAATLALPANQTMAEASYDPNADLMVSKVVAAAAQPTEAQPVQFTRVVAVVKMSLKNFNVEAGDEVEKVVFMADGKALAGTITADLNAPHEFEVAEGVSSVSVTTNASDAIYFNVLPTTLEAGDTYTIVVVTNKKLYVKQGAIAENPLELLAGKVNRFGVNMMGVMGSNKWTLVKDASSLKEGDVITFVAKDYDKAISKNLYNNASETSTSARRDAVDVSKLDNFLIANDDVQPFTMVAGTAEGTFSFYDATREKFLVSNNKSSRYLISQSFMDANTSFAIAINAEDGDATVKNTEGEYAGNMIRYYNSSKYFYSGTSANQAICVYRLEGAVGDIPVVKANVTVPDAGESIVIAEEATAEATAFDTEQVKFNYVGAWTISAAADVDWLSVAYDSVNNYLTYTAEANTGAKREAVVTITAEMEGQESLSWSFNVMQKGVPQDITIAEFITLAKDENSTYRLTGRITEMTTSSSGTFKLADAEGNSATIQYLYTDGGVKVSGNNEIGVAVGDVMTVTAIPAGSGKGGNSSHYSIYKGHYGIGLTMGLAADYTGGSVEIAVATYSNGTITLPEAVTASMTENDFAELAYDGGDVATVTFGSENTTSAAREAEVTFTYGLTSVTAIAQQGINPANKLGYELVTDASTLTVGDEVIIVAKNSDKALGVSTGTITSQTNFPGADIVRSGNVIYDAEEAGVVIFTLVDSEADGKFALEFTHKTSDYYLYLGSSSLKGSTSLGNYTRFSIDIESEGGVATITNSASTAAVITFNATSGKFGATKVSSLDAADTTNDIAIYKKQSSK